MNKLLNAPGFGLRWSYNVVINDTLGDQTADARKGSSRCISLEFFRHLYNLKYGDFEKAIFKVIFAMIDQQQISTVVTCVDLDFCSQKLVPCIRRLTWFTAKTTTGRVFRYMRIPHVSTIPRAPSLQRGGRKTVDEQLSYISEMCAQEYIPQ